MNHSRSARTLATLLAGAILHLGIAGTAQAALIDTAAAAMPQSPPADGARARVRAFLDRPELAAEFARLGVPSAEARARVDAMTDPEVQALAQRIDEAPAGADALGTIVGAAVLVFIVLLVTDILGYTRVFSFTKPVKR
ncbi:MAG: PA2779 family protein [Betaproteobacteria bacterium]|jgi:hypothetical protein